MFSKYLISMASNNFAYVYRSILINLWPLMFYSFHFLLYCIYLLLGTFSSLLNILVYLRCIQISNFCVNPIIPKAQEKTENRGLINDSFIFIWLIALRTQRLPGIMASYAYNPSALKLRQEVAWSLKAAPGQRLCNF